MIPFAVFFNDTATTEIYTLSLHDALPIYRAPASACCTIVRTLRTKFESRQPCQRTDPQLELAVPGETRPLRSEEHTSELQSRQYLVCRLLLETNTATTLPEHRILLSARAS